VTLASSSHELAQAIADKTGERVEVVELLSESLGEPGPGGETYLALVETYAERISDALALEQPAAGRAPL
jgi:ABC-type Zn uptake system ZnuABC Zn-binding protein ZnuA